MVVEHELLPYWTWLAGDWWHGGGHLGAALQFLIVAAVLALIALLVGFFVALVRYGPLKGGDLTYRMVTSGLVELARTSRRRIVALARHAIIESWRRRVFVALIVFFVVLLFAGWFLETGYREPGKLFFSFALTTTTYLVLFIALLVSAFSLPQEFKSKTIFTLVTKPVRAGDIILGRILGLTLIGTAMLIVMAVSNYVFVTRMLYHTHDVEIGSLTTVTDANGKVIGQKGRTSLTQAHRHEVELDPSGNGVALFANSHEHAVTGSNSKYVVSAPLDVMRARVPEYGKLKFERNGFRGEGVSVGAEWTYRRFIEGGTSDTAIWTFNHIDESKLRTSTEGVEVLPIELIVRVFRTYKGIIGQGIHGSMKLRNPETGRESSLWTFTAKDASGGVASADGKRQGDELPSINYFSWPRKLDDKDQNAIDLLKDLVSKDGQLEMHVQCLEPQQYYGFAQPDGFIRLADRSPLWNYCKAQISIWIQMLMVIAIAVAASTLVNGPVAMLFTASFILLGFFREFFVGVATGTEAGGGPIESFVRLITQRNLMTGLQEGESTAVDLMKAADWVLLQVMHSISYVLPDFRSYSTVDYVASGFDIPINKVCQDLTMVVAYVAGLSVLAYFFFKTREVAK